MEKTKQGNLFEEFSKTPFDRITGGPVNIISDDIFESEDSVDEQKQDQKETLKKQETIEKPTDKSAQETSDIKNVDKEETTIKAAVDKENEIDIKEAKELLDEYGVVIKNAKMDIDQLKELQDKVENVSSKKELNDIKDVLSSLVEEGVIYPFDNNKDIKDYSLEEVQNLIKANIESIKEEVLEQFTDSLPEPIQLAIEYVLEEDKSDNLPSLLRMMADAMEGKNALNSVSDEQKVKAWLLGKGIEDEEAESLIRSYKAKGVFNEKLQQAEKELDAAIKKDLEESVNKKKQLKEQKEKLFKEYIDGVNNAIASMPIDKKIKKDLQLGLTSLTYDSMSGAKTNELYHLLEKYQFQDKKYDIVAKVLWYLKDPEGFEDYIRENVKKEVIKETIVPKLRKAEQVVKSGETINVDDEIKSRRQKPDSTERLLKKPKFRFDI